MINLRALSYLVALGEYKNFSRAAEHCCITQSTLSIQLRKLEDYLGVELVERTRARVQLTAAGKQVSLLARMILATSGEIQQVAQRTRAAASIAGSRKEVVTATGREAAIDEINCLRPSKG
jgi:LysR family hydrogen peroxide-inducible transcriptional activator